MINKLRLLRNAIISSPQTKSHTKLNSALFSGLEWFNIGVVPNANTRMEVNCKSNVIETTFVAGCRVAYANKMFSLATNYSGGQGWLFQIGHMVRDTKALVPDMDALSNVKLYLSQSDSTINNISLSYTFPSLTTTLPIFIGACNQNGVPEGRNFKGVIYSVRIWNGLTLIRDCIPVKLSTGEVVFFDMINEVYYHNEGKGQIEDGKIGLWEYPTNIYMNNNGDFVLEYDNELYPEWKYDNNTGNVYLVYDDGISPNIRIDNYGNILVNKEG